MTPVLVHRFYMTHVGGAQSRYKQPVGYNESLVHHTGEYLVRYANRIAMSNSRLVAIEGQEVVFRYRDHHDGGTWRTTSLPGVEFLARFLWHLVPRGLRRKWAS